MIFEEFRNNVLCRRIDNQTKARNLYQIIREKLPSGIEKDFSIEWSHYMINEIDSEMFGEEVKKLENYLDNV